MNDIDSYGEGCTRYCINFSDKYIVNNELKVTYECEDTSPAKIEFDSSITASLFRPNRSPLSISTNNLVYDKEYVDFDVTLEDEDKVVDYWLINGTKKVATYSGDNDMSYTISKSDYVTEDGTKKLKITYVTRDKKDILINFDSSKYWCYDETNSCELNDGDYVKEQNNLIFRLRDESKFVDSWQTKEGEITSNSSSYPDDSLSYIASTESFEILGVETSDAASATITLGSDITCTKYGVTVSSGATVYERKELVFSAPSAKRWYINGVATDYPQSVFIEIIITREMIQNGSIDITISDT